MKHYPFGSSTAHRTDNCPGWFKQSEGLPRSESQYARDGTIIHALLEEWALDEDYEFTAQVGRVVDGGEVNDDHIERAAYIADLTDGVLEQYKADALEPEVTGEYDKDVGGTIDLVADCPDRALLIDYKTGQGHLVSAENNKQILFTAWVGATKSSARDILHKHENFTGIIIQPNDRGQREIKTWDFTIDEVQAFAKTHRKNIQIAKEGGPLNAGEHCTFCPAAAICPERTGQALAALQMDPEDVETLGSALDMIEPLKAWIKAVERTAYDQLEIGTDIPGWKLVPKRASRKWRDQDEALKKLRRLLGGKKAIVKEALLSPAQIETLAKANGVSLDLEELTVAESSGSTLAPDDDPRAAVPSAAAFGEALKTVTG